MIPSIISAVWMIRKSIYEKELNDFIVSELPNQYILSKNIDYKDNTITIVTVGDVITSEKLTGLNNDMVNYGLKNKKLIIKQEGIDLTNLEQYMESLKNNQNNIINNQNNKSNNMVVGEIDKNEIFNELRAIYPEIKQMYFGYVDGENDDNDNNIDVLIIYSDNVDLNKNINNIQSWFKIRVNSDKAKVYIEIIAE